MYKNNYFTETANAILKLDKNPKRGYNEKKRSIFDDDEMANSAIDYLYADANKSKTQGFLTSNKFPTAGDRQWNRQLYGVEEERKQMRDFLKSRTNNILNPGLNENDRAFLHGLMGEEDGERDYQNRITDASRRQSDLMNAFRGSQFESGLRLTLPKGNSSPSPRLITSDKLDTNDKIGHTVFRNFDKEYDRPQYSDSKTVASTLKTVADSTNNLMSTLDLSTKKEKNATQSYGKPYYKGHDGCINGQNRNASVNKLSYGKDIIANNGCELLAVHNALALKNNQQDFKEIIEVAETTKGVMWFGGRFGSHPDQLGKLLDHYEQEYTSTTQKTKFNELLEDGGIYIVSTWNPGALTIHTVAFSCDSENNIIIYNRYGGKVAPYRYEATEQQTGLDLYLEECGKEIIMYKLI